MTEKPGVAYWNAIEPVWEAISIYDGPEVFLQEFQGIKPELGHLFAAHWCQSEVRNGGFYQFFYNPTGVLAPEAVVGLCAMGLSDCADVVQQAMDFFGDPYPREKDERLGLLPEDPEENPGQWDPFDELDNRLYELLDPENHGFEKAADDYVRKTG